MAAGICPGGSIRWLPQRRQGTLRCWLPYYRYQVRAGNTGEIQSEHLKVAAKFDVSSTCVNPVFRNSPFLLGDGAGTSRKTRILFLSEGNVCRSLYAEAIFRALLKESDLNGSVECMSKATKDYNAGEPPDERAAKVALDVGLELRQEGGAQVFKCPKDVAEFDLLIVMDKFNAADVLKEVSLFETIAKQERASYKVRRLGEFCKTRMIVDIDDPLYGNFGGTEEEDQLHQVMKDVEESCQGLLEFLKQVHSTLAGSEAFNQALKRHLRQMEALDWLAPPMLQK